MDREDDHLIPDADASGRLMSSASHEEDEADVPMAVNAHSQVNPSLVINDIPQPDTSSDRDEILEANNISNMSEGTESIPVNVDTDINVISQASSVPAPNIPLTSKEQNIRLIRTISMLLFYIAMGLYGGIMSPATYDLLNLYRCNIQDLGLAFAVKTFGIMTGSFMSGVIVNRYRQYTDLWLCIVNISAGLLNVGIPWHSNLYLVGFVVVVQGIMTGSSNVACNTVTMAEWLDKSPLALNALHTAYTVGVMLAPITAAPFLDHNHNITDTVYSMSSISLTMPALSIYPSEDWQYSGDSMINSSILSNSTHPYMSRVFIAYGIHGAVGVLGGLLFLMFYCVGWEYKSVQRQSPMNDTPTEQIRHRPEGRTFKVIVAGAMYLAYVSIVIRDAINPYVYWIAVQSGLMSKPKAVIYNTVYNGSWVAGRLFGTLLAKFLKVHVLVFGGVVTVLADTLCLSIFGLENLLTFWILTCALGLLSGPCYASVMAWANHYTEMGGITVAILDVGIGTGIFISMFGGGYILHHYKTTDIFLLCFAGSVFLAIVLIPLQIYFSIKGNRFSRRQTVQYTENQDNEPLITDS